MNEQIDQFFYRMRYLVAAVLIIVSLLIASFILSALGTDNSVKAAGSHSAPAYSSLGMSDSPNVVANGLGMATYQVSRTMASVGNAASSNLRFVTNAAIASGQFVTHGVGSIAHGIGSGFAIAGRGLASGIVFVVRIPINVADAVSSSGPVSAVIKPADHDPVPVIDPNSPALFAAQKSMAETAPATHAKSAQSAADQKAMWPIHGVITTEFGVPEPPYQPIHTGIDISDGKAPGVTPVHPFKPGKVIAVIHGGGLGNHVIVDHGHGVTSVYGHLNSTSVQVGQEVTHSTVLGYEGTTGVSTGTHLHFEIRVDGQAANPHGFIPGQP
ncbi:MAG TPA: M23 family metallopeptidase [Candidatus Saccharimonadales bacterium]|nr:M23 family metallopeptidase [Candidatus Saccharimonadales bacterium]